MTKAKSTTAVPKQGKSSARRGRSHSISQQKKLLAGRVDPASAPAKSAAPRQTKHDRVLTMLRSREGATLAALMKATGWQQHSVRGFLTGVVRRRLKLDLVSEKPGKDRIYRIKAGRSSAAKRPYR